jgi:antitoxin ParD1/3/4
MVRREACGNGLRTEVVPAHQALKADPSTSLPLDEIQAGLEKRHRCLTAGE